MARYGVACAIVLFALTIGQIGVSSQGGTSLVRVTPLGSHAGELCTFRPCHVVRGSHRHPHSL